MRVKAPSDKQRIALSTSHRPRKGDIFCSTACGTWAGANSDELIWQQSPHRRTRRPKSSSSRMRIWTRASTSSRPMRRAASQEDVFDLRMANAHEARPESSKDDSLDKGHLHPWKDQVLEDRVGAVSLLPHDNLQLGVLEGKSCKSLLREWRPCTSRRRQGRSAACSQ